jgi:hypothetical protein
MRGLPASDKAIITSIGKTLRIVLISLRPGRAILRRARIGCNAALIGPAPPIIVNTCVPIRGISLPMKVRRA